MQKKKVKNNFWFYIAIILLILVVGYLTYEGISGRVVSEESVGSFACGGGDGSIGNPYQVCNWTDLDNVRRNLSANYILMKSLSSNDGDYFVKWNPIGATLCDFSFSGSFNGNGNYI